MQNAAALPPFPPPRLASVGVLPAEQEQPLCAVSPACARCCGPACVRREAGRMQGVIVLLFLPSPPCSKAPLGISSQKNYFVKNITQTWPGFVVVRVYHLCF